MDNSDNPASQPPSQNQEIVTNPSAEVSKSNVLANPEILPYERLSFPSFLPFFSSFSFSFFPISYRSAGRHFPCRLIKSVGWFAFFSPSFFCYIPLR